MALGDGVTWVETTPTDASAANTIDDLIVEVKKGVRQRMENEHVWPSSQTGTAEGGKHKHITLSITTTGADSFVDGERVAAIIAASVGTGYELQAATILADTTAGENVTLTRQGRSQASCIRTTTADPASPIVGEIWFRSDL